MSQPLTFQATNNHSPLRIGHILFTVLALLSFALGSILISLVWFGVDVTATGKDLYADAEVRTFVLIVIRPATMLAVWIFSTLALALVKRWLLASLSLQAAELVVALGSALLVVQRISYITGDEPVYIEERFDRPDRVQYRVMFRRHDDEGSSSKIDGFRAVFAEHAPAAGE